MSYSILVWLGPQAPPMQEMGEHLAARLSGEAEVEATAAEVSVREGSWQFRGHYSAGAWVAEEAQELSSMLKGISDEQRARLQGATARLEFEAQPEEATDDHYNTWLLATEALAELDGVVVFSPFDGQVLGG